MFAEIKGQVQEDPALRVIRFLGVDDILVTIPLESMQYWKYAMIIQDTRPDTRLTRPKVVAPTRTRPEEFEWPADTNY